MEESKEDKHESIEGKKKESPQQNNNSELCVDTSLTSPLPLTSTTNVSSSPSNSSSGERNVMFTESQLVKYKNKFFEFIEELKMRRVSNDDKEVKLHELLSLKHKLEQDLVREKEKLSQFIESQVNLETETQKKFNEQLRQLEEDKVKISYSYEGKEKEFQSLKDELRALHMSKYSLEKTLREQEYSLQVLNTSRDSYHDQLSQMEQQCVNIEEQVRDINEHINTLESNVKEAVGLNKQLEYVNNHQECIYNECAKELEEYRKECITLKAQLRSSELPVDTSEHSSINQQLKVEKELVHQLQEQLSDLRGEFCSVLQLLKDAHLLIDKHVDTINQSCSRENNLKETVRQLTEQVSTLEGQLVKQNEESTKNIEILEHQSKQYTNEIGDISVRLKHLKDDYIHLQSSYEEIEKDKVAMTTRNTNNEHLLEETKRKLEEMKSEMAEVQNKLNCIEKEKNELAQKYLEIQTTSITSTNDNEVQYSIDDISLLEQPMVECDTASPDIISSAATIHSSPPTIILPDNKGSPNITSPNLTTSPPPIKRPDDDTTSSPSKKLKLDDMTLVCTEATETYCNSLITDILDHVITNEQEKIININHTSTTSGLPVTINSSSTNESNSINTSHQVDDISISIKDQQAVVADTSSQGGDHKDVLMFSSSDDDDEMMDSQLTRQINKVQSLLLIDRLKRKKKTIK